MPLEPLTGEDFLDLWRRVLPADYTCPIEDEADGQGADAVESAAQVWARFEQASNNTTQAYYLAPSSLQTAPPAAGQAFSTAELTITREAPTTPELVLPAGTPLRARQRNTLGDTNYIVEFVLTADVVLPVGVSSTTGTCVATFPGPLGDVAAESIEITPPFSGTFPGTLSAIDTLTVDEASEAWIGRYVSVSGLPSGDTSLRRVIASGAGTVQVDPAFDPGDVGSDCDIDVLLWTTLGVQATNPQAAEGGVCGFLDAIGRDRGMGRANGESDEAYRRRLRTLADVVSPAAMERIARRILLPLGIRWLILETGLCEEIGGFTWDVHPYDLPPDQGRLCPVEKLPGSELECQGIVWMDPPRYWRHFVVCVSLGNQGEWGAPYDATNSPNPNAYDTMFYDGFPVTYNAAIASLYRELDAARAAGVSFEIVQDPDL